MLQTKAVPKHQEEETVVLLSDSEEEEQQDEVEPEEVGTLLAVAPSPQTTPGGLLGILGAMSAVSVTIGTAKDTFTSVLQ